MSATLALELDASPIERLEADLAVAPWFEDERPLRGAAGRLDWRLCGQLSRLAAEGSAAGAAGEAILLTTSGGLRAPLVLALGQGRRQDFGLSNVQQLGYDAALRSADLLVASVALPFPGELPGAKGLRRRTAAMVTGLATALAERSADLRVLLVVEPGEVGAITDSLGTVSLRGAAADVTVRLAAQKPASGPRAGNSAESAGVFPSGSSPVK